MRYFFLLLYLFYPSYAVAVKKIYIAQIVQHPALNKTRDGIINELNNSYCKYNECEIKVDDIQGNLNLATQVAKKYKSKDIDIAVALGTAVAQILKTQLKNTNTTIIFSSVTDPLNSKLVESLDKPEGNITGVSNFMPLEPQLEFYKKQFPNLQKLGIIYNPSEINSARLVKLLTEKVQKYNIKIITRTAFKTSEVGGAAAGLGKLTDAIFISNDNTSLSSFPVIVKIAKKFAKPVFVSDVDLMGQGADMSIGPDQYKLGQQTARMIIRILKGQTVINNPVEFPQEFVKLLKS